MLALREYFWNWGGITPPTPTPTPTGRRSNEGGGKKKNNYLSPPLDYWEIRQKHLEKLHNISIPNPEEPVKQQKTKRLEKRRQNLISQINIADSVYKFNLVINEIQKLADEIGKIQESVDDDILIVLLMSA